MIDIAAFFQDNDRVRIYRAGACDEAGTCVLYWMQRGHARAVHASDSL
jgi:hypothetical protein